MSQKVNNLEKIFVGMVIVILTLGLFLHHGLQKNININKETIVSKGEKAYIDRFKKDNRDISNTEKKYLRYLENEKESENLKNIARVEYFLGINNYSKGDFQVAAKYFRDAKEKFVKENNYFYILNINSYLMQVFFAKENYREVLKVYHETYELLKRKDIKGVEDTELDRIKINTTTALLKVSTSLGMFDIADMYYEELIELTNKTEVGIPVSSFAKYFYNLKTENFMLAEQYAKEYIKTIENITTDDKVMLKGAYLPLLNVYIESDQFEKAAEPFKILEEACKEKDSSRIEGSLLTAKGLYAEKVKKDFQEAMESYKQALDRFRKVNDGENTLKVIGYIVRLRKHVDIDLSYYIKLGREMYEQYDSKIRTSELADILNTMSRENVKKEQVEIIQQSKINEKIIKVSNFMGIIYVVIIALLILITKNFKKEVLKREQKEKEFEKITTKDFLTKAYSKQYMFEKISEHMERNEQFKFVLVDIDNFKRINDNYTHCYGDKVLVEIVQEIKESIIEFGYVGRFGGDEFIIVLYGNVNTRLILSLMREKINHRRYGLEKIKVTVSAGGVKWHGQTIDELINEADMLVMEAKANGKDKIVLK